MLSLDQHELARQQCNAFEERGCIVDFAIRSTGREPEPMIMIITLDNKSYHFCDPDWEVVNRQLTQLYRNKLQ